MIPFGCPLFCVKTYSMGIANWFMKTHISVYQKTGGKFGGNLFGNPILLLHSVGRKSGKVYISPLTYFQDEDNYVIIGSNGGQDRHPGWYYNLQSQPETAVQVNAQMFNVQARLAEGDEREVLWERICRKHGQYPKYQAKTSRQIPLFILEPKC